MCSLVLSDSSVFLKFWLADECRENFLLHVATPDLASLRLVCHDFSVRAAPALFNDLSITFKSGTFTKPTRIAALDRIGYHVKMLSFNMPHTVDTVLPPLVDPETGAELSYTYTPQTSAPDTTIGKVRRPKYGDRGTTDILVKQYPPLFHAATNVSAFVRAFSAVVNLEHLKVSCPDHDPSQRYRRSVVDFALISLRMAMERNSFNSLEALSLLPIHSGGILYLSPLLGYGATPNASRKWSKIRKLNINMDSSPITETDGQSNHLRLLQTYLRTFSPNLTNFHFQWNGNKGPSPIVQPLMSSREIPQHPALSDESPRPTECLKRKREARALHFPKIQRLELENISTSAHDVSAFITTHKRTLEELNLEDVELTSGTWDDALAPLIKSKTNRRKQEIAEIPIMLSPEHEYPNPMGRVDLREPPTPTRSMRMSGWLSKSRRMEAARRVKEGCEEHLRKLRGSVFPWR